MIKDTGPPLGRLVFNKYTCKLIMVVKLVNLKY